MKVWQVADAQLRVNLARALDDEPLPGWIAELAKVDLDNLPTGSIAEFRASLPESVPEFAVLEPFKKQSRWRFWRYW